MPGSIEIFYHQKMRALWPAGMYLDLDASDSYHWIVPIVNMWAAVVRYSVPSTLAETVFPTSAIGQLQFPPSKKVPKSSTALLCLLQSGSLSCIRKMFKFGDSFRLGFARARRNLEGSTGRRCSILVCGAQEAKAETNAMPPAAPQTAT
jgi:hypothetical protein